LTALSARGIDGSGPTTVPSEEPMNMQRFVPLLLAACLLPSSCGKPKDQILTASSVEEAKLLAAKENTHILVKFWSSG
jgi:hypothetical protein